MEGLLGVAEWATCCCRCCWELARGGGLGSGEHKGVGWREVGLQQAATVVVLPVVRMCDVAEQHAGSCALVDVFGCLQLRMPPEIQVDDGRCVCHANHLC
jgi:hypothetical protein